MWDDEIFVSVGSFINAVLYVSRVSIINGEKCYHKIYCTPIITSDEVLPENTTLK